MTCGTVDLSNLEAIIDMVLTTNDAEFFRALLQTPGFQNEVRSSYLVLRDHQFNLERYAALVIGWVVIGIEIGLQQAQVKKPGAVHDQN
mgnify:CR=1 FL=1